MTHAHTPAGPDHAGTPQPVSPYRWLLVGHSPQWRAAARDFVQQQPGPVAAWRRDQTLVQVLAPDELAQALHTVLAARPRLTRVLVEPGLRDRVAQGLRFQLPQDRPVALRLGTLAAPFDVLRTPLARAEGLAAEQWLLSGRQHWPRYDWPGADDNARAAAAAAFRAWADDLLASLGSEALDELVGIDVDADLVDQDWDDGDAPMPPLQPVPAFALPLPPGRRLGQGLGLAASAAAAGPAAGPPPPWVREGTVQDHPGDRYQLRAARRSGRPGHASDRVTLDVTLTLDAVRWQGRRRVVLELHQQRRLPLQGLLGDVPAGPAAPGASVTLRGTLNAPASLLQADAAALALWLRYEADEPSTRH